MEKKSVLSTLRFIFFSVTILALIVSAVTFTVMNIYKPTYKVNLNDKFIGYFSSRQEFDEVYKTLENEKKEGGVEVKVYLDSEPTFEQIYIREELLAKQNIYTNLRAELKTEYTIYKVIVDEKDEIVFNSSEDANNYKTKVETEVAKINSKATVKTEIKEEKIYEIPQTTAIERADNVVNEVVNRNKPIVKTVTKTTNNYTATSSNKTASTQIATVAAAEGGIWPTTARRISSYYGYRPSMGDFHTGTDIDGDIGDPIYAYKTGYVTFAGWSGSYGYLIKIDHGNGVASWYAHCNSISVKAGQSVGQGQVIGKVGSTGWSTGSHLHFEIRINGNSVNSLPYIQGK